VKIVATSDLHGHLPQNLPNGDVLVIAGDITLNYKSDYISQAEFINFQFREWANSLVSLGKYKDIVWIAGNHDKFLEDHPKLFCPSPFDKRVHYLENNGVTIDGVNFWGTPDTEPFCGWGFNTPREKRKEIFSKIPEDVDVLISHGPPKVGMLGKCVNGYDAGDEVLVDCIRRVQPEYCFCGHIHEGGGEVEVIGETVCMNVSYVNFQYTPIQNSWKTVEIKKEKSHDGIFHALRARLGLYKKRIP